MTTETDTTIETLRQTVRDAHSRRGTEPEEDLSGVYFFLSLDLVNSTKFKTAQRDRWLPMLGSFYDEAVQEVFASFAGPKSSSLWEGAFDGVQPTLWKYAGDEVLFYLRLESKRQAVLCVPAAFEALAATRSAVETNSGGELSVKGTCWSAVVDYVHRANLRVKGAQTAALNVMLMTDLSDGSSVFDFLGPDIDAGFRTTASSVRGVLVVGPDLAWFMSKHGAPKDVLDNLRLVEIKELKGVWNGRYYPIVYYANWARADSEFEYDDPFRYPLLANALNLSHPQTAKLLDRAITATDRKGVIAGWGPRLGQIRHKQANEDVAVVDPEPRVTIHCAAICFNSRGQVMLAKRHPGKRILPDTWEYGCAQLRPGDTLKSAVIRDYEEDFCIKVDFSKWEEPVPIATYAIGAVPNQVSGIIVVAECDGPEEIKVTENRHTEARWFDPTKLPDKTVEKVVPHLESQVGQAVKVWRSVQAR